MDQIIEKIIFIFCHTGQFVLWHEITFQFDAPAEAFVCATSAVVSSDCWTGENGFFKTVQTQQVCSRCCKPEQENEYEYQKYFFDKFDGIHGR